MISAHDVKDSYQCHKCNSNSSTNDNFKGHKNSAYRFLKIGSLNICRGLFSKKELLIDTLQEKNFDIFGVSEIDLENVDEEKPFTLKGYKSYFPLKDLKSDAKKLHTYFAL